MASRRLSRAAACCHCAFIGVFSVPAHPRLLLPALCDNTMAPKQQPTVLIRLTNKERMAVYAVLVKYEEESEEAAPWQLRGDAQSKTYSELCIMVRPHLRQVIRDQYTGEKLKALVESNHKEAAKVCRSDGGEYDAADEEQVAHWKNMDAITRSLQADVRTASRRASNYAPTP